jgi:manganese efflux pump family protein
MNCWTVLWLVSRAEDPGADKQSSLFGRARAEGVLKIVETLLIALALGCDAFAVGLGVGTRCCAPRQVFRLSFHFGLFQFLMPVVGWLLGVHLLSFTQRWGSWIAFVLLFIIGVKMTYESLGSPEEKISCPDPTRGLSLVTLSVATSLDALGVGFGLGMLGQQLLLPALVIGFTAAGMTWSAMKLGGRLSEKFGRRMGIAGGVILMAIAFKLLIL